MSETFPSAGKRYQSEAEETRAREVRYREMRYRLVALRDELVAGSAGMSSEAEAIDPTAEREFGAQLKAMADHVALTCGAQMKRVFAAEIHDILDGKDP